MTVYEFAKKCMSDAEFNKGGIVKNERKYVDAVGFEYKAANGQIIEGGADLNRFYEAMSTLQYSQNKYNKVQ